MILYKTAEPSDVKGNRFSRFIKQKKAKALKYKPLSREKTTKPSIGRMRFGAAEIIKISA
ncbi:hypothetical protein GCM10010954_16070 [Halobacillus andaensis]|uniref:Uncharacterized protein n=1 Tax=Halobacillus andaensis TaxID=1176239 RepID=A0A917B225_HALAA|nr:hypothetical protein GCM10010954_16070 [Halobacillus andaensis]